MPDTHLDPQLAQATDAERRGDAARQETKEKRRVRLPLQAATAIGVIVLLAVVVALLSWQSYRSAQRALISASDDTVSYIRESIAEKVKRTLEPAAAQLNFLVRGTLSQATTLPDRLREVPLMADALQHNPLLDAIYIGYPNGEFVLFRFLGGDDAMRSRLQAVSGAVLAVQSITLDATGKSVGEYRFYNADNNLIGSRIDPNYHYDPRSRPWYESAVAQTGMVMTRPYAFFTNGAAGLTLAQRTLDGGGVIGLDIRLSSIAAQIQQLHITPSTEMALVNLDRNIIAYQGQRPLMLRDVEGTPRLAKLEELQSPTLSRAADMAFASDAPSRTSMESEGRTWQIIQSNIDVNETRKLKLLIAAPNDEFFAAARGLVVRQFQVVGLIMLLAIPAVWLLTRQVAAPLRHLAERARRIEGFDFSRRPRVRSYFAEVDDLGGASHHMTRTIRKFLSIGRALAAERDFKPLLDRVLSETINVVGADGGAICMIGDDQRTLTPEIVRWVERGALVEEREMPAVELDERGIFADIAAAVRSRSIIVKERALEPFELDSLGLRKLAVAKASTRLALVIVPLLDRNQEPFAIMTLAKALRGETESWNVDDRLLSLIHAISGTASVAMHNKLLLDQQRQLVKALIQLVAGAIDAKSPYTAGHCERVPVLTRMLAEAAAGETTGPFQGFAPTDEEWEALDIASWLHDCGKVTTPEYVVDKATKLETIYDRIHEIRMRFEVLKCQAETVYWRGVARGGDEPALRAAMEEEKRGLDDDFAFIARSNEGGEFLDPAMVERIKKIAGRRWVRTISNRLGVSYEEKTRLDRQPEPALPVEEPLLADRYDHIVEPDEREIIPADNMWGFVLEVPKVKYNRGEVYNLSIARGTLTAEERYRINDHIVQTIIMLRSLPLPKYLRNVPELAGGHHEKMDGTGYPRRLRGDQMSEIARMMAIADVFEALTAADRPYKKAKKLSEAIRIMGFMKKERHLDPDLLDLFLTSGVWRDYAERFLMPEQIDEPDIDSVVGIRPAA
jgi:HD-GYP domain-containing protein (c-di-GMP phosphodiesterase class II)